MLANFQFCNESRLIFWILQASLETVRTAAGFVKFLKSNAKVPFEAPDIPEPESEDESEESVVKEEEAGQVEENDTKDEL